MIAMLLLSSAGCVLAIMIIVIMIMEQTRREIRSDRKIQEVGCDVTLVHSNIAENHAKIMKKTRDIEGYSSASAARLDAIESRLETIEKILLDVSPILYPMTRSHARRNEEGKEGKEGGKEHPRETIGNVFDTIFVEIQKDTQWNSSIEGKHHG